MRVFLLVPLLAYGCTTDQRRPLTDLEAREDSATLWRSGRAWCETDSCPESETDSARVYLAGMLETGGAGCGQGPPGMEDAGEFPVASFLDYLRFQTCLLGCTVIDEGCMADCPENAHAQHIERCFLQRMSACATDEGASCRALYLVALCSGDAGPLASCVLDDDACFEQARWTCIE